MRWNADDDVIKTMRNLVLSLGERFLEGDEIELQMRIVAAFEFDVS